MSRLWSIESPALIEGSNKDSLTIRLETKTEKGSLSHCSYQMKGSEWPKCKEMESINADIGMLIPNFRFE